MLRRRFTLPLLLLCSLSLSAQMPTTDVEIGYRWVDIEGSEDVYRTQINEQDGLLLRAFRISGGQFGSSDFVDHFRADASDLGAGPAGALRIEAGKLDRWNLNLNFRQADAFNFHPGVAFGQHRVDRTRTSFDLDLEFLPGHTIAPFIGYSQGSYDGPGTTTYTLGGDDFLLNSDMEETEREIRGGIAFNTGRFSGVVLQGWRQLESDETMTLFEGAGAGNNPGNVLGRPVNAAGISRESNFEVSTPFTNAHVTAELSSRMRLIGNFSRFAAEGDGPELETASGSFVSFRLGRFFSGLTDEVSSRAENTTWRGGLRAEIGLTDKIDLLAGWRTENRDLDGAAAFNTIFRDTTNFSGVDPVAALEEIFETENAMSRDEDTLEVGFSARQLGPFSLRANYSRTTQDVFLSPDIEEIVVSGPEQGGAYTRTIDTLDAVGAFSKSGFTASLALRHDSADDSILRTDYLDRDRVRIRAAYLFRRMLRVGAMAERSEHENDRNGIGYESETDQYGVDAELMMGERFRLRGAYSVFDTDAQSLILHPENFSTEIWSYLEEGDSIEGGLTVLFAPITFDADYTSFKNEGSNPFDIDRLRARVVWDFVTRAGIAAEWSHDEYEESLFPTADFDATRYGIYLRWRM